MRLLQTPGLAYNGQKTFVNHYPVNSQA